MKGSDLDQKIQDYTNTITSCNNNIKSISTATPVAVTTSLIFSTSTIISSLIVGPLAATFFAVSVIIAPVAIFTTLGLLAFKAHYESEKKTAESDLEKFNKLKDSSKDVSNKENNNKNDQNISQQNQSLDKSNFTIANDQKDSIPFADQQADQQNASFETNKEDRNPNGENNTQNDEF